MNVFICHIMDMLQPVYFAYVMFMSGYDADPTP